MFARITTCLLFVSTSLVCAAPNVLFIAVDDLRPELGCYGSSHIKSPNIDKLAASSVLFERAYCQVAVCNPSRNSVLSGFRSDTTTILANNTYLRPTLPDVVTLPQHFKNNGYTSLSLGKIFHHSTTEPGDDPQSWSEPSWYQGKPYRHWFTKESEDFIKEMKQKPKKDQPRLIRARPYEASNEPDDVYPDGQTAVKAIETLQRLKSEGKPFFLGVGFVKPHLPFTCPQKYWNLYPEDSIHMPENSSPPEGVPSPALHDLYELRTYGGIPRTSDIDEATALKLIRAYRACVSFMDAQLGRVIDELDRLGLRENTIIVLWGDHGYHLGEQGFFTKMTNFELGTRVPLLVSAPGLKGAGQKSRALVELVDIYPSLADLAGLPIADFLEGTSFAPLLDNPDRWRYTEWKTPKGQDAGTELYDHETDPKETVNLAQKTKYAETVQQLSAQLKAGWKEAIPAP